MRKSVFCAFVLLWSCMSFAQTSVNLNLSSWEFSRDSVKWESVSVPHDWAISGPFDKKWDMQTVAIVQNGETEATEKTGRSGALPWIGRGFYRTHVNINEMPAHAELQFDGAMSDAHVWVNGTFVGGWPYGYNAFRLDVLDALKEGDNIIEVSLNNLEESSRWYPGGGIYRPVHLFMSNHAYVDDWNTQIVPMIGQIENARKAKSGSLHVKTAIVGFDASAAKVEIYDAKKNLVTSTDNMSLSAGGAVSFDIPMKDINLWSPESPYLYIARVCVMDRKNEMVDCRDFKVGMKKVEINSNGFALNGEKRKFKGVCLHHDLGPLGAAVNKAALIRQAKILKDMGCDAIRTSHNMPSTMQMEVYDSLGLMVMAESFDMWRYPKCKNGYAKHFEQWAEKDITNLVLNHRNHASLVMWSIGNEIPEQWTDDGWGTRTAIRLQSLCHQLDADPNGYRVHPVTQGMDNADGAIANGFAQVMDIPGYNYRVHRYDDGIKSLPQQFILGSETASTVSSRGVYKFPVQLRPNVNHPDGQCTGYDTEYCAWSCTPDDDFLMADDRDWTIGQFVWTGFDYLGEPTPYDEYWPSRSSYFGICDLAGLPKDRYYLYRSQWNTESHTIHLLPHWTFPERVGEVTPVYCYTDYPEAELFVNGKSQGRIKKQMEQHDITTSGRTNWNETMSEEDGIRYAKETSLLDRYRLRWNNVVYEPGEIKVVCYDKYGNVAGEQTVKTAGKAKSLNLEAPEVVEIAKDGDLAYITISLADAVGTMIPDADDDIEISVKGAGQFKCVCNGDATSVEVFTQPKMKLFKGMLVATVQSNGNPGMVTVTVKDKTKKFTARKIIQFK
ncbi:MAG: DUF4982 domain-containing protein [Prevotellaceae bacterium]|nr:DUF4982 domain-containing protein [Prevotellaceae bacterium]